MIAHGHHQQQTTNCSQHTKSSDFRFATPTARATTRPITAARVPSFTATSTSVQGTFCALSSSRQLDLTEYKFSRNVFTATLGHSLARALSQGWRIEVGIAALTPVTLGQQKQERLPYLES